MAEVVHMRPAVPSDGVFLGDMLVEAANWRVGAARPRHEVLSTSHRRYVAGWMRPSDVGIIAVDGTGEPIGAAWYRVLPPDEPGFGFVGTSVPELIIGIRPVWRARGIGRALLQELTARAAASGYRRISLSVEHDNFARLLYQSEGFIVTTAGPVRDTMVRVL
ncbi:GNAT family N-acetyltransferase [Microbacterium sp.]|uniref:GNAT family N-acetyltransferase n=1 Tax=Microbacterium sp. TaxID=51671 RepID=UPI0039E652B5